MKCLCEPQLFLTIGGLARAVDNKLQVDVAILDFAKAFDKLAHARLAHKTELLWYKRRSTTTASTLSCELYTKVVIDAIQSSPCRVTSGVPQGSLTYHL